MMLILMKMILIFLFMSDLWLDVININNVKDAKKSISKELTTLAWNSTGWLDWCMPENERKEIEPSFTDKANLVESWQKW